MNPRAKSLERFAVSEIQTRQYQAYLEQLTENEEFQLHNTRDVPPLLNELPPEVGDPLRNQLNELSTRRDQAMPSTQAALYQVRVEVIIAYYSTQNQEVRFLEQVDPQGNPVTEPSRLVFPIAISSKRKPRQPKSKL